MKFKAFLLLFSLIIVVSSGIAQNPSEKTGNWLMYFGMNKLSDKWSIHTEIQHRNHVIPFDLEQLLLRTGMNYHINKNFMVSGGYAYITGHAYQESNEILSKEHRIWQQLIIRNKLSRLYFEHRYRYEQRWVDQTFRQRARYRLMINIPLNNTKIEKGTVSFHVYDEVFLNIEKGNVFDRNRLYGAFGYQLLDNMGVQVGLLNQAVTETSKLNLQFGLIFNPDLRK